ncbi:DUF11 domain-containing protein, partial [Plantibacter sp. CFBP 8804]|nr:DUF11 domain-containing protein [Plantibacter sp. CFBP 8804]
ASANTNLVVSGVARLDVVKEICFVTPKGSCDWISNPDVVVGVDPDASDIRYRVSFVNSGNTVLTNLVGYDVLPHLADGRGSTFAETLNTITSKSANLTLTYSSSTNPCRAEVLPSNPGCKTGWASTASGASAIRAQVTGTLAPGGSTRFEFTANVVPGAPAGAVACNSVAIDSSSTLPAEPRPVCATTQEADLKVSVPDRLPLQAGRPGTVPFTITNLGGSAAAPATVDIAIPAGIRITSVTPMGWTCDASDVASDGAILGPVTLTCSPVTDSGAPRTLTINTPDALNLPAVIPGGELVGEKTCFAATVTGIMSDPVNTNNNDTACFVVAQGKNLLKLTKDDGRTSVAMGEEFTYTIDVANLLTGETLSDVAVTDELPSTLAFVSANAGGTVSNQSASDSDGLRPGGTVTWPVSTLAAAGVIRNGDIGTGGAGSTQALTVTVRVVQAAETDNKISNSARATAIDPTLPGVTLSASDDDTNELVRSSAISLTKTTDVETVQAIDDTITYSFLVTNTGDVTLSDITVEETQFTGAGNAPQVTCIDGAAALAPGDSTTCTAAYLITQADLDAGSVQNTATASGTAPTGVETPTSKPSTATVTVAQTPSIALEKTALPATVRAAGDTIEYTFTVTNTGNVSVSDVAITETAFTGTGDDIKVVCDATNAAPQQSVVCTGSYKVTQADVNAGHIDNTAIATAVAISDVNVASDPSSVAMTIVAEPGISLVKSATPTDLVLNDKVTYSFVITNTGNVSIQDIAVAEGAFTGTGELSAIDCGDDRTLDPDKQLICEADYVITQDDVDAGVLSNTATATATAPTGSISSDASTVELSVDQLPQLSLLKTADVDGLTAVGEEVEYRFRVTNTGNVTLTEIAVLEQNFSGTNPLPSITCDDNRLLPGEYVECVAPYSVTQEDIDAGSLTNTATANANSPGSDQPITAEPSTLVLPFTGATAIGLTKTGTPIDVNSDSRITANDRIRWSFSVTNDGAATLTDLAISDPMAGTITCTATELSPGKRTDCAATAEYEITAADATTGEVRNVATASASGIGTATISSGEAHAVVQVGMVPPASTGSLSITGNDPRINLLLALFALLAGTSAIIATRRQSSAGVSR